MDQTPGRKPSVDEPSEGVSCPPELDFYLPEWDRQAILTAAAVDHAAIDHDILQLIQLWETFGVIHHGFLMRHLPGISMGELVDSYLLMHLDDEKIEFVDYLASCKCHPDSLLQTMALAVYPLYDVFECLKQGASVTKKVQLYHSALFRCTYVGLLDRVALHMQIVMSNSANLPQPNVHEFLTKGDVPFVKFYSVLLRLQGGTSECPRLHEFLSTLLFVEHIVETLRFGECGSAGIGEIGALDWPVFTDLPNMLQYYRTLQAEAFEKTTQDLYPWARDRVETETEPFIRDHSAETSSQIILSIQLYYHPMVMALPVYPPPPPPPPDASYISPPPFGHPFTSGSLIELKTEGQNQGSLRRPRPDSALEARSDSLGSKRRRNSSATLFP